MVKIKRFFEASIYDVDWHDIAPKRMVVDGHAFVQGNIMMHSDMVQVTYENELDEWGIPSTLEFDFYFSKKGDKMRIDVDITIGDYMAAEFYIEQPNKVEQTYSGNLRLCKKCIENLAHFLSKFGGFSVNAAQLGFLA